MHLLTDVFANHSQSERNGTSTLTTVEWIKSAVAGEAYCTPTLLSSMRKLRLSSLHSRISIMDGLMVGHLGRGIWLFALPLEVLR
jgi:hypothetical protein